jgi:hypothetical protein
MRPMMLSLLLPGIVLAWVLVRAYTEVDDAYVDEWGQAHGLALTPANRPMVRWYLHTARILRTWGAVAGLVLPALVGAAFGSDALKDLLFPLVFVGYLAGAVYAEVALVRAPTGARRVANLVPRVVADYLPRRLMLAQRIIPAAVVAGTGLAWVLGFRARQGSGLSLGQGAWMAVISAVLAAVVIPRLERWLVERPQPFVDADLIAADDALRSQSVHSVAGSGLAIELLCLGTALFLLAQTDVQVLRWTMWVPALACFWGSIAACVYYGHRAWRVRRTATAPLPST